MLEHTPGGARCLRRGDAEIPRIVRNDAPGNGSCREPVSFCNIDHPTRDSDESATEPSASDRSRRQQPHAATRPVHGSQFLPMDRS